MQTSRGGQKQRGQGTSALPSFLRLGEGLAYFAFTGMCFGFASSTFGRVSVSTPFLNSASALSGSTVLGSVTERWNLPKRRSWKLIHGMELPT